MNKRWIALSLPVILLISSACLAVTGLGQTVRGSGTMETENRPVSGFDRIDVCCGMQLTLTQGTAESLEIEADDNLLEEITVTVVGGRLTVRYRDSSGSTQYRPTQPVQVRVRAVDIRGVEVSGGGRLDAAQIDTDHLDLNFSGGSHAELGAVTADSLSVGMSGGGSLSASGLSLQSLTADVSGGGELELAGSVVDQQIQMSGGSVYRAADLESETVSIDMSGGGEASVWVKEELAASLSGGARVEYYGTPRLTQNLSGGSDLVGLGER